MHSAPAAQPFKGILLMLAGTAFLSWNDAVAKHITQTLPVGQVVCLRQSWGLLLVAAYGLATEGGRAFRIGDPGLQFRRAAAFVASTLFIVTALSLLPIALVTAIAFSSPIGVALLSAPMLGEAVSRRRWLAVIAGFFGVLVVIRPGGPSFEWILLLPLAAALFSALRDVLTRRLARTDTSLSILFWSSALVVVVAGLSAVAGNWKPVGGREAAWLVLNGTLNVAAHFLMIHAYRFGDAALLSPYRYTGLIWAAVLGFLVWSQLPDAWTLAGSLIIVFASAYAADARKSQNELATGVQPEGRSRGM
jgi:drug/metabolite transporter (DMT)-like permease